MKKIWKDAEHNTHYYYREFDGRIVGQIYNIAHTKVWGCKILIEHNEEKYLGLYISEHYAKLAIEEYWDTQERTFDENPWHGRELVHQQV